MLNREQFLAKDDTPTDVVDVPEWGEKVTVRMLTAGDRLAWATAASKASKGEPGPNPLALLVALSAVDDSGNRLFQVQDCDVLADKRGDVINRIADAVLELSGMNDETGETAGNSEATQSGSSPSDSPETSGEPSPS